MIKKPVLLFIALLLPVTIFLFLHYFGQNKFDIPIYHETPSTDLPEDCQLDYQFPYKVFSTRVEIDGPTIIFFTSGLTDDILDDSKYQLARLNEEFGIKAPKLIQLNRGTGSVAGVTEIVLDSAAYEKEKGCVFLAGSDRLVLVDGERQIRGYYESSSLKEIDRLIVELKILFKDY